VDDQVRKALELKGFEHVPVPVPVRFKEPGTHASRTRPGRRGVEACVETEPYTIRLHHNPDALPRASLVRSARVVIDVPMAGGPGSRPQAALMNPDFDPRREVLIVAGRGERVPIAPGFPTDPVDAPVHLEACEPHRVRFRVNAPEPSWLFLSDTWYPGWSARVDGREERIFRANVAGRAVQVPAGEHTVEFRYPPFSFVLGCLLAAGGLLSLLTVPLQKRLVQKLVRS
jgi:hypothetical protein